MHFDIAYNQDRVIEVNVSTDAARTVRRRPALPRRPSQMRMGARARARAGGRLGGRRAERGRRDRARGVYVLGGLDADRHAVRAAHGEVPARAVPAAAPRGARPGAGRPNPAPAAAAARALTRGRRVPQIHWFSIINSCVTVLLLTGFLATILLRVLRNDFLRFSRDDEGAR